MLWPPLKLVLVSIEAQGCLEVLDNQSHQHLSGDPQGAAEPGAFLPWGRAGLGWVIQAAESWSVGQGRTLTWGARMKAEGGNGTQVPSWTMEEVFPCTVTKVLV